MVDANGRSHVGSGGGRGANTPNLLKAPLYNTLNYLINDDNNY